MDRLVNIERSGSSTILTMMNPPVNALTRELAAAIREAWSTLATERIIVTGSGKMFVAGADIREIERITRREIEPDMRYLNELLSEIEKSQGLVVMAMNGGSLGIGLELAMAGHYRILEASAEIGLPEVKLGLIPGAGGTQRLPRLAGVDAALRMCVTGEIISAAEALRLGIVDENCEGNLIERAQLIQSGRRTDQIPCTSSPDWDQWKQRGARGQRSPQRAVDAIRAAVESSNFETGLAAEAKLFKDALLDEQARAMVHLFFAERELNKVPWVDKGTTPATIERVATLGDEIEIEAQGKCRLKPSPAEYGGRVVEVRHQADMKSGTLAAALQFVRKQGKLAVVISGDRWLGSHDLDANTASQYLTEGRALRPGDIDVLMVRGFGYPEELGGPMHAYSTTPSQISESLREPLK